MVRDIPHFRGFTSDIVTGLARLFSIVELEPGTQLFNEGEEGDKFFVVLQGEVVIIVPPTTVSMDSSSGDSSSGGGAERASESGGSGGGGCELVLV